MRKPDQMTPEEQKAWAQVDEFQTINNGYWREQATRPQTLGYALADSPIGSAVAQHRVLERSRSRWALRRNGTTRYFRQRGAQRVSHLPGPLRMAGSVVELRYGFRTRNARAGHFEEHGPGAWRRSSLTGYLTAPARDRSSVLAAIAAACKSANSAGAGVLAAVSLSARGSAVRAWMMPGVVSVMVAQMVTWSLSSR